MPNIVELNNGKRIEVLDAKPDNFSVEQTIQEMIEMFDELTENNLKTLKYMIDEDVVQILGNKRRTKVDYENGIATYYLEDIDIIEQRIQALEDTVDTLVLADIMDEDLIESERE